MIDGHVGQVGRIEGGEGFAESGGGSDGRAGQGKALENIKCAGIGQSRGRGDDGGLSVGVSAGAGPRGQAGGRAGDGHQMAWVGVAVIGHQEVVGENQGAERVVGADHHAVLGPVDEFIAGVRERL